MHRAIFIGNGFPFNEKYFQEFDKRKNLLFGNYEQRKTITESASAGKEAAFYRSLKPANILDISQNYQLDYVIIETEHSSSFSMFKPEFENADYKIFKVSNFAQSQ